MAPLSLKNATCDVTGPLGLEETPIFAGVDGCRLGWVCAGFDASGRFSVGVHTRLGDLLEKLGNTNLVLIDLPIGLPDGLVMTDRLCDSVVRRLLGARSSSVFPAPCRDAVYASDHREASAIQRRLTGKGLSQQAWALATKIRNLDEWIQANSAQQKRVHESHPELAFFVLNGNRPLRWSKHDYLGGLERATLLKEYFAELEPLLSAHVGPGLGSDDLMDAMVLALHAREGARSGLSSIPGKDVRDGKGLRVEMVYARSLASADTQLIP